MATIRLDGPQIEELKNLPGAAFLPPRFTEFLLYRLNRNIWNYTGATDDYPTILLREPAPRAPAPRAQCPEQCPASGH